MSRIEELAPLSYGSAWLSAGILHHSCSVILSHSVIFSCHPHGESVIRYKIVHTWICQFLTIINPKAQKNKLNYSESWRRDLIKDADHVCQLNGTCPIIFGHHELALIMSLWHELDMNLSNYQTTYFIFYNIFLNFYNGLGTTMVWIHLVSDNPPFSIQWTRQE